MSRLSPEQFERRQYHCLAFNVALILLAIYGYCY